MRNQITWQQAAQQMYNNLDAIPSEADKDFVSSAMMLAESGEQAAQQVLVRLTHIYKQYLALVNAQTTSDLQSDAVSLQTNVGWLEAVREMNDNSIMVVSDSDKEFVQGIALMLDMGEPVPASYSSRVEEIYKKFRYHQDL